MLVEHDRRDDHKYEFRYTDEYRASRDGSYHRDHLRERKERKHQRAPYLLVRHGDVHRDRHRRQKHGCRTVAYAPAEMHLSALGYHARPYADIINQQLRRDQYAQKGECSAHVIDEIRLFQTVATVDGKFVYRERQKAEERRKRETFHLVVELITRYAAHEHARGDEKICKPESACAQLPGSVIYEVKDETSDHGHENDEHVCEI